jgi:hypothetical protein
MDVNKITPWQIFHSILATHEETTLTLSGERIYAIRWLSKTDPRYKGEPLLNPSVHGAYFHPYSTPAIFEGHQGQFLALLSETKLPLTHKFTIGVKEYTLQDFINHTKETINGQGELTWILWGLQQYVDPDEIWRTKQGESWSIEELVRREVEADIIGAPCGGNHRLFALTRSRDRFIQKWKRPFGVWASADQRIQEYIEKAKSLQNPDGSFSGNFYRNNNQPVDTNRVLTTTGHTLEFLAIALPERRLAEPWVQNAVSKLCDALNDFKSKQEIGPVYHSLDALILYQERLYRYDNFSPN